MSAAASASRSRSVFSSGTPPSLLCSMPSTTHTRDLVEKLKKRVPARMPTQAHCCRKIRNVPLRRQAAQMLFAPAARRLPWSRRWSGAVPGALARAGSPVWARTLSELSRANVRLPDRRVHHPLSALWKLEPLTDRDQPRRPTRHQQVRLRSTTFHQRAKARCARAQRRRTDTDRGFPRRDACTCSEVGYASCFMVLEDAY